MVDTSGGDLVSPGYRYFARTDSGKPQIGAYLPDYDSNLTVYWRGRVGRQDLQALIDRAEAALLKSSKFVSGTIDAYGIEASDPRDTERHIGPVTSALAESLSPKSGLPSFDACRAELTVPQGTVIIWANVSGDETASLEDGGENIGVSVPQTLFQNGIRPVLETAIATTMRMKADTVGRLLNDITTAIQKRALTPG